MRRRRGESALLLILMGLTACSANWQPVSLIEPRPLDKKTVMEFHAGEKLVRLHGVSFTRDSVSGIPWIDHLSCDTCRVSYSLAAISGTRTGNPGKGAWYLLTPMLVLLGAGMVAALSLGSQGAN